MCNRYANKVSYRGYIEEFSDTRLPLLSPPPDHAPNLEPRDNIFPTEPAPVFLPIDGGLALKELRWGLIPWFHKTVKEWTVLGTNARSYVSTATGGMCLVFYNSFWQEGENWLPRIGSSWRSIFCFLPLRVH